MAKICNSRSKVYETRGVVEDEPVEHIESEGERLIKQMVQKQLDPHVNLGQELKREQNFKSVQETLPLTAYVRGETTLKEFEQTTEKVAHIEELKSFGLSNDEIQLLLDYERDILAEKYKKTERSILSSQIESILKKIECAKTERSNETVFQRFSYENGNSLWDVTKVLYVKNLAGSVINDDLVSLFGHFETDSGTRIMYRLLTGRMRGQAFVTFPSTSLAMKAMKLVNGYVLKGKPLILQFGKAKEDHDGGHNDAVR
ncbi:Uncharacterized protein GBIM_04340 [Gryllus bimaculatus]|nr:Uncharacterized protein GBIM_04340 [Gryllus bimaculatus]